MQKLGTEFGNSNSQMNIFSELGEPISSCDPDLKKGAGSSSPSPSRDFDQDSLTNPNLLSILQPKDSLNLHQAPFR